MRNTYLILVFLIIQVQSVFATHIVGGDFWVRPKQNFIFEVNLNLYFDLINGNPGAKDFRVIAHLMKKSDDERMKSFVLPLVADSESVPYQERECFAFALINTAILRYRAEIVMSPDSFDHPQGYYLIWDRCCRNGTITNIEEPGAASQLFYAELPPVVRNGLPYINHTPRFEQLPNIIFCNGQISNINFSAFDSDGDSLVYDLVDPLLGATSQSMPVTVDPLIGPTSPVIWKPGFGTANQIPGTPALLVNSRTGFLTVMPNIIGLFVFSVRCSEFRNGVKIGEVRREFQQKVVDCQPNNPPNITLRSQQTGNRIKKGDTLSVVVNRQRGYCLPVRVIDPQVGQTILVRAEVAQAVLPSPLSIDSAKKIGFSGDTLLFNICFPLCYETPVNQPLQLYIIAEDNGCAGSLGDTTFIFLNIKLQPNPPRGLEMRPNQALYELGFGEKANFILISRLPSDYSSFLSSYAVNLPGTRSNPEFYSFPNLNQPVEGGDVLEFIWTAPCLPLKEQPITLYFVNTTRICSSFFSDTVAVQFIVNPRFVKPKIFIKEHPDEDPGTLLGSPGKESQLTLVAETGRDDLIRLQPEVNAELLKQFDIQLEPKSGTGRIESVLSWSPKCIGNWAEGFTFKVFGISNACQISNYDTLRLKFDLNRETQKTLGPVNLITINEDGKNDQMDINSLLSSEFRCGLPFKSFEVFSRWGKKVYETTDPAFSWRANGLHPGLYYYLGSFENYLVSSWLLIQK